ELGSAMQAVALGAPGDLAWTAPGATPADMRDLAAVFVTPRDPAVDRLQRQAQERSAWKSFGAGVAYQRSPLVTDDVVGPGEHLYETVVLEPGERIGWQLLATSGAVDVFL